MIKKFVDSKYFDVCVDILFVVIAMFVAFYARENFVYYTSVANYYFFEGQRILTTNDAYHFATATKDLIEGHTKDGFYPIASMELLPLLTYFLYKILPFSLDSIMFIMPVIFSVLLAIPVYFFAKDISNKYVALFAAMLAPMISAYTQRTFAGYYDTDMLILVLPMCAVYFLYRLLKSYSMRDVIFCAIFCILALVWHKVSATYVLALSIFIAIVYIFITNAKNTKLLGAMGILLICVSYFDIFAKIILLCVILHFMSDKVLLLDSVTQKIKVKLKYLCIIIFLIGCAVFLITNSEIITSRFATYVSEHMIASSSISVKSTSGTIMELAHMSVKELMESIGGDVVIFVLGVIGAVIMFIKNPRTLLLLSMLLLGISSIKLGSRFAMFGATTFSIGFFYLVYFCSNYIDKILKEKRIAQAIKAAILISFAFFVIAPHYYYARALLLPPVLNGTEINALQAIREDSTSRHDLTISWWDYGFAIPYYSNTRSLISGVDLDGINHFLASFVLTTSNQTAAYNMVKLIVQALDLPPHDSLEKHHNIDRILYRYGAQDNPKGFFESIGSADFAAPKIQNNIYLYLPISILVTQTAISEFSDIDYSSADTIHKDKTLAQFSHIEKNPNLTEENAGDESSEDSAESENATSSAEFNAEFAESIKSAESNAKTHAESSAEIQESSAEIAQDYVDNLDDVESTYLLDGEIMFYADSGILKNPEGKTLQAQAFHILERAENGENGIGDMVERKITYSDDNNLLHVIYAKELKMFFIIDDWTNSSLVVQFFMYENYDKDLFTLIHADKGAKAYKLR